MQHELARDWNIEEVRRAEMRQNKTRDVEKKLEESRNIRRLMANIETIERRLAVEMVR